MRLASLRRASLALTCLLLLASGLAARQAHVFHADQDLPGFEAAGLSEWSALYALDLFKQSEGKELAAAELESLRARWQAAQESAKQRIAAIQADVRERAVWQLECRLARHSYFSKISWTLERPEPGLVVVVQHPAKEQPGYVARILQYYLPFARRAEANFLAQIVQPAGLARQEGREITAFAVLASKGDFENFTRFMQDEMAFSGRSAYDYRLQLAVVFEDAFAEGDSVVAQHTSLCYRIVKELEHAHLAVPGNRPGSMMLDDGLAELFAAHEGATPEALDRRSLRAQSLEALVLLLGKQDSRELLLLPLDQLAGLRSWSDYGKTLAERAKSAGATVPAEEQAGPAYYVQAELWLHFLFDGAEGARRAQLLEFVKAAFTGRGDATDLRRVFGIADMGALSREFLRWCCAEYERTHEGTKVDRTPIDGLFLTAAASSPASGSAPAPAPAPLVSPSFSPGTIAPHGDDAEAQFALALAGARDGDVEGALGDLRALAALSPAEPWAGRIARSVPRLEELAKLRRGYLGSLAASGGKFSFKQQGKPLLAPVLGVEKDLVRLGENRLGLPSLPLASVDPYEVAKLAAKPEQQGGAQPWARFFAYALAGDARWEKLLKDDSPAARELRKDAQDFPELARVAAAARELYELSKLPLPGEAQEAGARLERIRKLLAANPVPGPVARQTDALRELAKACLLADRRAGAVDGLLHATAEPLDEGRTRLVWNFDKPEEALDWTRDPAHIKRWRSEFPKLVTPDTDAGFKLEEGHFVGLGSICYRCAALFEGPLTLMVRARRLEAKGEAGPSYFDYLICDEGDDQFIVASATGYIRVHDTKQNYEREARGEGNGTYTLETDYDYKIVHDGQQVSCFVDDELRAKAGCGPRRKGAVVLFAHSDFPISIDRIVIEGRLQEASRRELEQAWLARRLAEVGFH